MYIIYKIITSIHKPTLLLTIDLVTCGRTN